MEQLRLMTVPDQFMQDINAQSITAALLGEVMIMFASLSSDEWNDFDRRLQRVVDFVDEKRCSANGPLHAMAVALRLMALDAIVVDPEIRGWLMPGKPRDGITYYLHGDLLKVATEQPVLEGPAGEPIFDSEAFRSRLMELAASRGRA
jgi:hypothetical protein